MQAGNSLRARNHQAEANLRDMNDQERAEKSECALREQQRSETIARLQRAIGKQNGLSISAEA